MSYSLGGLSFLGAAQGLCRPHYTSSGSWQSVTGSDRGLLPSIYDGYVRSVTLFRSEEVNKLPNIPHLGQIIDSYLMV